MKKTSSSHNGFTAIVLIENEQVVTWCGIADAHGIESFQRRDSMDAKSVYVLQMRAGLNRQRHAVYYEVGLTEQWSNTVVRCIEQNDFIMALRILQDSRCAPTYGVSALGCNEAELHNSWELIPDPALDPWHVSEESGWVPPSAYEQKSVAELLGMTEEE